MTTTLITIVLWFVMPITAEESINKKNGEILTGLCQSMLSSLIDQKIISSNDSLMITQDGTPADNYFLSLTQSYFLDRHIVLFDSSKSEIPKLHLSFFQPVIEYTPIASFPLLGTQTVKRTITLNCNWSLRDRTGKILNASFYEKAVTDTIPRAMISIAENPPSELTRGLMKGTNYFERLMEPAVIIAAVGVTIYLFFTIRS
jgi:hypothetical protein